MYTYHACATGLTASFPPSLQDGGFESLWHGLQRPKIREQMKKEMNTNARIGKIHIMVLFHKLRVPGPIQVVLDNHLLPPCE